MVKFMLFIVFSSPSSIIDLCEMFNGPTRITESTSSHLDVFLRNCSFAFADVLVKPIGFSDHHIVMGTYLARRTHPPCTHKVVYARSYRKLDSDLLCDLFTDEAWDTVLSFDNVSDTVQCFTSVLQGLLDFLIPEHKIRVRQNVSPWAAGVDVTAARRQRDRLHHQALATGDPAIWQQYRPSRNRANKLLRTARYTYLSQLTSSMRGQASKFWSYFHYLSSRKAQTPVSLENLNFTLDNLNQHFLSVADKVVQGIIPTLVSPLSFVTETVSAFQFTTVSEALVISIISSLDTKKASGADNIPTRFIKIHPVSIGRLVTRLINHSITSGIFPELWKYAVVTPIQKSKDNMELTKPISVLPVLSKVLERVVHDQLVSHLLKFNLLSDRQSGFCPQHSTQDVLVYVTDCWRKAIDESKFTAAAFLDLSKGFDCVNHDILLSKLSCYGVMDNSLVWFASYLSGRRQRVNLRRSFSDWGMIRAGVPRGSILGPL